MSESQWAMVREDNREVGNTRNYFTRDPARYRAYKPGKDGLSRLCDHKRALSFALALRNECSPQIFVTRLCAVLQAATAS